MCVEVLSPERHLARMPSRLNDYLAMASNTSGASIPALATRCYIATGFVVATEPSLAIPCTSISITLAEVSDVLN